MCDGMKIAKRLMLIGVILIVLSMTMATQYVTTKISYRYSIVHPSDADLRFIGSDISSDDIRVLRMTGGNSSTSAMELRFGGNISANQNKTYTCAFGIVNEEDFDVNITHINVTTTGTGDDYMQIWLHGDRDALKEADPSAIKVWDGPNGGSQGYHNASNVWVLAAGNHDSSNMCDHLTGGSTQIDTPWDSTAHVRYSTNDENNSVSGTSDFVWVQVSLNLPANADVDDTYTGTIFIFTESTTR